MATTVTYKGQTLATVENQTKTLQTAGKWCEDDFTLTDDSGGGMKATLLWTNPSPNSAFSPRTLNIDFTPYEYFVVECKATTTSAGYQYNIVPINTTWKYICMACGGTYDVRFCTFTTSSITIANAQWSPSSTVNNEHIIPLNIYGVKKLNLG